MTPKDSTADDRSMAPPTRITVGLNDLAVVALFVAITWSIAAVGDPTWTPTPGQYALFVVSGGYLATYTFVLRGNE